MENVATFKTTRNQSTALVVIDQMSPKDALEMHTAVKNQGRGSVSAFVKNETPYEGYAKYYYELKKKGVVPFKPRGPRKQSYSPLELRVQQLEMELAASYLTPSKRAMTVLQSALEEVTGSSRKFLCDIIARDRASLSQKQEKWLSDLEVAFT